jgi:hypothetical protein
MSRGRALTRHFFHALFDLGFLTAEGADAFIRVVFGIFGVIIGFGLLIARMYMIKYGPLEGGVDPVPYLEALNADTAMTFGLSMWIIAFIAVLISHSLVPDETDFRVLMPLPLRQSFVFGAKLLALLLFVGLFTAASLVALTPITFIIVSSRHAPALPPVGLLAFWLVGAAGCVFVVLAVIAVNGLMSMCLPKSRIHAATAAMRSAMLAALMLVLPATLALPADAGLLAQHSRWMYLAPPAWFLGIDRVIFGGADKYLWRLAGIGFLAFASAVGISFVTYALLYHRFDRVMLRSLQVTGRRRSWRGTIGDFTHATLRRSALHQGVLVGLSALGLALGVNRFLNPDVIAWLHRLDTPKFDVVLAVMGIPWLLMFVIGLATRWAIALPIDHRASWVFRITEDETTRARHLHAVTRLMRQTTVLFPLMLMAPLEWALFGPRAIFALATNAACALFWVEILLHGWRRLPFTCSYIPGKQAVAQTTVVGIGALVLGVTLIGGLAVQSARSPVFGVVVVGLLSLLTWAFRRARLTLWNETPLEFDDHMPSAVEWLSLTTSG